MAGNTVIETKDAISISLAESQPTDEPILVEEGYESFNIMLFGSTYYGLSQGEGAFEPQRAESNEYESCFSGSSIATIEKAINASSQHETQAIDAGNWKPQLIEDDYHGFNIVRFGDRYYGLPQGQGGFDIESFHKNEYDHCYQTATADEIRSIIDKVAARSNNSAEPILIEEGYRGYNIVLFGDKYYAVAQNGDAFDASRI